MKVDQYMDNYIEQVKELFGLLVYPMWGLNASYLSLVTNICIRLSIDEVFSTWKPATEFEFCWVSTCAS